MSEKRNDGGWKHSKDIEVVDFSFWEEKLGRVAIDPFLQVGIVSSGTEKPLLSTCTELGFERK